MNNVVFTRYVIIVLNYNLSKRIDTGKGEEFYKNKITFSEKIVLFLVNSRLLWG